MRGVRIVHLSDLHIGAPESTGTSGSDLRSIAAVFLRSRERRLRKLLKSLDPPADFLVVTGDLIDSPRGGNSKERSAARRQRFGKAVTFVESLQGTLRPQEQDPGGLPTALRTLIVPGNHDISWDDEEERFFAFKEAVGRKFLSPFHSGTDLPAEVRQCRAAFVFPEHGVLFYAFVSSILGGYRRESVVEAKNLLAELKKHRKGRRTVARIDRVCEELSLLEREDPPAVGRGAIEDFEEAMEAVRTDEPGGRYRNIALIHHHLGHYYTVELKRYEQAIDAGPLKSALAKYGFDVVLHGHKHTPFLAYEHTTDFANAGLHFVGAGTALHGAGGTPSFFIVDLHRGGYQVTEAVDSNDYQIHESPKWACYASRPPWNTVRDFPVLAPSGYRQSASLRGLTARHGLRFVEHSGVKGGLTSLFLDDAAFTAVIEDEDTLLRLNRHREITLKRALPGRRELLQRLPRGVIGRQSSAAILPIRCGLNAVAYKRESGPGHSWNFSYRQLLMEESAALEHVEIAFWDQPFASLPFLLLATGVIDKLARAWSAAEPQFTEMVRRLELCEVFRRRVNRVVPTIDQLGRDLQAGWVEAVVGGGAWLKSLEGGDGIESYVPDDGCLFWVESVGLLEESKYCPPEFLEALLDPSVQRELAVGRSYSACPVVPEAAKDFWARDVCDTHKIFADKKFTRLRAGVVRRQVPEERFLYLWEEAWTQVKKLILERYRVGAA